MKINNMITSRLRNDAHFQFHTEVQRFLWQTNQSPLLNIDAQIEKYEFAINEEDKALKKINKSFYTERIQEADKMRDETFLGMVELNRAMCKHFAPHIRDAACRLQIVFDTYGRINVKPLNEQTSAIYNLLQDLDSTKYRLDANHVGIIDWLRELETRNNNFADLVRQRFEESAKKVNVVMKEARKNTDDIYNEIIEFINAKVVIDGIEKYDNVVKTLNVIIAKFTFRRQRHAQEVEEEDDKV